MGDFGRTPKINSAAGRDHWAGSTVFGIGGGGIRVGDVLGKSDRYAEQPTTKMVQAEDIVATTFSRLGDPARPPLHGARRAALPRQPGRSRARGAVRVSKGSFIPGLSGGVRMTASIRILTVVARVYPAASQAAAGDERVSFATDVQPILTKLGCNQGAGHGAQYGKGSFKLSLRGFDDEADHREIVRTAFGRRVSLGDPAASLLLRKPTLGLPHEGGRRLAEDSWAYRRLVRWLRQGAPGPASTDRKLKDLVVEPKELILQPGGKAQRHGEGRLRGRLDGASDREGRVRQPGPDGRHGRRGRHIKATAAVARQR